ncbi:protein kinase 2b chloroplastic, partial [Phtheirospermum japonicum]
VRPIEFKELKKATQNFRPDLILGEGGFGPVYKGWIDEQTLIASKPGYGMPVAVKIWDRENKHGHEEVLKEIHYLSQLHHPNLIKLVGYCFEQDNMILVHEFMPKGSLDNHLFGRHQTLSWATRIKVAIDAARALSFLHGKDKPVIHRDFKTANMLLDGEYNAKLYDFGLARDMTDDTTRVIGTYVMGTSGYAAPEYVATGFLTTKCDVYSFGVVVLELLSGRRAIDRNRVGNEQYLTDWAKPYLRNKRQVSRVMDTRLEGQYSSKKVYAVANIALQCLSPDPKQRPRMDEVLVALERL